eukprot:scaffold166299_cov32-Tisochrysis_lutea.AAC.1
MHRLGLGSGLALDESGPASSAGRESSSTQPNHHPAPILRAHPIVYRACCRALVYRDVGPAALLPAAKLLVARPCAQSPMACFSACCYVPHARWRHACARKMSALWRSPALAEQRMSGCLAARVRPPLRRWCCQAQSSGKHGSGSPGGCAKMRRTAR